MYNERLAQHRVKVVYVESTGAAIREGYCREVCVRD